jgi:hypothetical protein
MINAWFNERGYRFTTPRGEGKFAYELPSATVDNAAALYASRWMVLNQMMDAIKNSGEDTKGQDITLYTDGRLIEELRGDIKPETSYARSSLYYFITYDYVYFRRIILEKCTTSTIDGKLSEAISA